MEMDGYSCIIMRVWTRYIEKVIGKHMCASNCLMYNGSLREDEYHT